MARLIFAILATLLIVSRHTYSLESCCSDLGCFNSGFPFYDPPARPVNTAPKCEILSTFKLYLNTRRNPLYVQPLDPYNPSTIGNSFFNPNLGTKLLIHGFTDNYHWPWWTDMVAALLKEGDYNVIRADIEKASESPFTQGVANSRLAGAYIAKFVNILKDQYNHDPKNVHIISHSLGVQVSAYVGAGVNKIGRITGLDPGGLYFTNTNPAVRLDPTDALMIDTIITDGDRAFLPIYALGSMQPMGHLNFYVNGGWEQPGCISNYWSTLFGNPTAYNNSAYDMLGSVAQNMYQSVGCSHWRAFFLFLDSIDKSKCQMKGYLCDSYAKFQNGECFKCAGKNCAPFGYHLDNSLVEGNTMKNFYMNTNEQVPFCSYNYQLKMKLQDKTTASEATLERGEIRVTLHGTKGNSDRLLLTKEVIDLQPGANLSFFFQVPKDLGVINSIVLNWDAQYSMFNPWDWMLRHYIYLAGDFQLTDESETSAFFRPATTKVEELKDVHAGRRN